MFSIVAKKEFIKLGALIAACALVLIACQLNKPIVPPPQDISENPDQAGNRETEATTSISGMLAAQANIHKFNNIAELKVFLEEHVPVSTMTDYGLGRGGIAAKSMESAAVPAQPDAVAEDSAAGSAQTAEEPADYSETNVQVEGVDEADLIKTDGSYIYAVTGNELFIVKAYPGSEAETVSKIKFDSYPENIFVDKDKLVVMGADNAIYQAEIYSSFKRRSPYAFLKVFDITDRKNPKQVKDLDFEGSYFNSRMIGGYVYFVTNNYSWLADDTIPYPRILEDKKELSAGQGVPDIYYFDIPYDSVNFTNIAAVNIQNPEQEISSQSYLLSGSQNMYVSQNNIYITYTKYINEYDLHIRMMRELIMDRLAAADQEKIKKIEEADSYILAPEEKLNKINVIIERHIMSLPEKEQNDLENELDAKMKQKYEDISKELEKTVIHKIAIDKDKIEYKTVGEVTGSALNQFSMDENNGYFRIATTKGQSWSIYIADESRESYNNIYVLDADLKVVGSLEKLAPGERIYSVRFMGNKAYMVTFKQTDPLFAIDLADPAAPKLLGQLKIPGFSNYLHPYDENTLIGIGKDASETSSGGVRTQGLKISLFDVSDTANPKEVAKQILGEAGSDSMALYDHKAFLFSKDKNLLVIPVTLVEGSTARRYGGFSFGGAAVFKVGKNSLELKGKIDHSDGGRQGTRESWMPYNYDDNTVKRSLYIEDELCTFSSKYLKFNKLQDLGEIKTVELNMIQGGGGNDFEVIN